MNKPSASNKSKTALTIVCIAGCVLATGAFAGDVTRDCVTIKQKDNGQVLFNMCKDTITVSWCVAKPGNPYKCTRYTDMANLRSGQEYAVDRGYVSYAACDGPDSMGPTSDGPRFTCK